jgi:sugar/nucleoside kinase (ribokinase family)
MDHIHLINAWPREQTVAYVDEMRRAPGGLAYNVLVDLAKFDLNIPLEGAGFVGNDDDGRRILQDCDTFNIDRSNVVTVPDMPTSYAEIMSVKSTGNRTCFHLKGPNNLLNFDTVPFDKINARIVHFGYLLIMDGIDAPDPEYGTVAAKILHRFQELGYVVSVDLVSEDSDRFLKLIPPALKYTDYLILNEWEAGKTTGHQILDGDRINTKALRESAKKLLEMGSAKLVCIHMHLGAYAITRQGDEHFQPAFLVPPDHIQGAIGAGDAFCAGLLAGIHEEWDLDRSLRFGTAAGAISLRESDATSGVRSAEEIWTLFDQYPLRDIAI